MSAKFLPLPTIADLEAHLSARPTPALLFLHDPYCPISSMALEEVEEVDAEIGYVDVHRQHDLSRAVARLTGVRHESPQFFVLRDGKVQWSASHGRIRGDAIRREMGPPPGA